MERQESVIIQRTEQKCGDEEAHLCTNAALENTAVPARNSGLSNDSTRVAFCDLIGHRSLVRGCPRARVVDLQSTLEDVLGKGIIETAADSESVGDTVALADGNHSTRSNTVELESNVSLGI